VTEGLHQEARVQEQGAAQEHPVAEGVQARECHVPGSDLERDDEVEGSGPERHDREEDHRRAVHREQLVVRRRVQEGVLGRAELDPHEQRLEPADQEEEEGADAVQDTDPLVIDGRHPAPHAAAVARRVRCGQGFGDRRHFKLSR
jgi:hypothetical protein